MGNCFIDREISWLQFNLRVLTEAEDETVPLLERLKFLNIYESNLDEFFMVRVGSLTHRSVLVPDYKDPKTGWTAATQLKKILKEVSTQQSRVARIYGSILYDLKANGIELVDINHISKLDESVAKKLYAEVKDLLSVKISDESKPIQFMGNKESYVVNFLQKGEKRLIGVTSLYRIPEFRVFDNDGIKKVFNMAELVAHFNKNLYKKYNVKESCIIRLTRNADVFLSSQNGAYSDAFKEEMEKLLKKRKRQQPVRLQIFGTPSSSFRQFIIKSIGIDEKRVFQSAVPLNLNFSSSLGNMPQLKYASRKSVRGTCLERGQLINAIKEKDLLLSFPYHSMNAFVDLIYEAADNRNVQSIKITLYRLSISSKVAMALAYAADRGKDVLCLLELRARFDEKNNIDYSEMLSEAGCKVIYGLPDMKVHAKLCLITMKNPKGSAKDSGVSYITQIGTGNYNEKTCEQYCDLSLMTADIDVARDAEKVFAALETGKAPERTECLMVAPNGYKQRLIELLEEQCELGPRGYVAIKVNSMNDMEVMRELIKCSKAGVKVNLYIRGICCLLPGIEGQTENISVKSVVGRYLEHSRVIVLGKGKSCRVFIGSGDLLNRNTNRRVEVLVEVKSRDAKRQILYLMDAFKNDSEKGWILDSEGLYTKPEYIKGTSSQDKLWHYFTKKS